MKKISLLTGIMGMLITHISLSVPFNNDLSVDVQVPEKKGLTRIRAGQQDVPVDINAPFYAHIGKKRFMFAPSNTKAKIQDIGQVTLHGSEAAPLADYSGKPGSADYDNIKGVLQ